VKPPTSLHQSPGVGRDGSILVLDDGVRAVSAAGGFTFRVRRRIDPITPKNPRRYELFRGPVRLSLTNVLLLWVQHRR
jgi:hypothetical protein